MIDCSLPIISLALARCFFSLCDLDLARLSWMDSAIKSSSASISLLMSSEMPSSLASLRADVIFFPEYLLSVRIDD